jgi:hypothetical protein
MQSLGSPTQPSGRSHKIQRTQVLLTSVQQSATPSWCGGGGGFISDCSLRLAVGSVPVCIALDSAGTLDRFPSGRHGAGDEPFDGFFTDGTPVDGAFSNDDGSLIWGAVTWQAEVSPFLIDANAGGEPREQLAQQLLAFIFSARHRLDDPDATIELPDGTLISAYDLIGDAIAAWTSSTAEEQNAMQELLNALIESDALPFVHYYSCPVIY